MNWDSLRDALLIVPILIMPIIHSNEDLLREKLRDIDGCCVEKRIGRANTYVFLIDYHEPDPSISILSDSFLENFIKRRHDLTSGTDSQPIRDKQPSAAVRSPTKPKQKSLPKRQDQAQAQAPPQPRPQHHGSQPPAQTQQGRPSQQQQQQPQQQPQPPQQRPQPAPQQQSEPQQRLPEPPDQKNPAQIQPQQRTQPQEPALPSPSQSPLRTREVTPISFARCETDALVIREDGPDEFAKYMDEDDDEEESELSKNLKKIRTKPPTQKPRTTEPPDFRQPAPPKAGPSASPASAAPQQHNPQPQVVNVPVEHKWSDTEARLNEGDLDNTYKDLSRHKDKIRSSDLAKQLLKQLVSKCFIQDETKWLLETLQIIFGLGGIFEGDHEFWEELTKRLQTKLSPVARYKSKDDHEHVKGIYKRALYILAQHFYETNQQLTLPFGTSIFLATPVVHKIDSQSQPSIITKLERKENSDPSIALALGERKIYPKFPNFQSKNQKYNPLEQFIIKRELKKEKMT